MKLHQLVRKFPEQLAVKNKEASMSLDLSPSTKFTWRFSIVSNLAWTTQFLCAKRGSMRCHFSHTKSSRWKPDNDWPRNSCSWHFVTTRWRPPQVVCLDLSACFQSACSLIFFSFQWRVSLWKRKRMLYPQPTMVLSYSTKQRPMRVLAKLLTTCNPRRRVVSTRPSHLSGAHLGAPLQTCISAPKLCEWNPQMSKVTLCCALLTSCFLERPHNSSRFVFLKKCFQAVVWCWKQTPVSQECWEDPLPHADLPRRWNFHSQSPFNQIHPEGAAFNFWGSWRKGHRLPNPRCQWAHEVKPHSTLWHIASTRRGSCPSCSKCPLLLSCHQLNDHFQHGCSWESLTDHHTGQHDLGGSDSAGKPYLYQ